MKVKADPEIFKMNAGNFKFYDVLMNKSLGTFSGQLLKKEVELTLPAEGAGFFRILQEE
jgi:hypothetical protein